MSFAADTQLGPYKIIALIGSGGVGEVYRGRDTRLNRAVALKVLPEVFAANTERMARFEREAKLLASLNHPNIAALYGLEESGSRRALVMELVEGPTLAERIAVGPIPVDEALPIAKQVAEALEYAHDRGVIHRDLKPANIKVTADGKVKVLDFGLAKAMSDEASESDIRNSPTISRAATRQGVILGTAAYMSPEQAKCKITDRRTDVWAFGCVLYEMLTSKQTFQGEDVTEVLAAVVRADPDWSQLPADTPSAIRMLLHRCPDKNTRQRLSHIGEARIAMEGLLSGNGLATVTETSASRALGWGAYIWGLAAVFAGAAITGIATWRLKPAPQVARPVSRFTYDLPTGQQFRNSGRDVMALSPDGLRFAYNTNQGLYLRSMDQLQARLFPGTKDILTNPFFSPDGQ